MLMISGCQESGTNTTTVFDKILFESDILEIANASFTLTKGQGGIVKKAEVVVYFRNRLTQPIYNLTLAIDFCDENENVLYSHPYEYMSAFPPGYTEASPNRFSYTRSNVYLVDHINIRITNYNLE
jgi:hypothetical protein